MQGLTIIFDLDGTLVDTAPDLVAATNHVLARVGAAPVDGDRLRPLISFGARAMIEHALAWREHELGTEEVDRLLEQFLAHYEANIAVHSRPYAGVADVLALLQEKGARLGVCTNKRERLSRSLLDALGLRAHFHAVVGRDTLTVAKPDPGHLIGTVIMAGGNLSRAVMVGDSETDVEAAKRAGIPIVGVSYGYTDRPMHSFAPDVLIDQFTELVPALARLSGPAVTGGTRSG